jgi:REP element-mobilizing transposase RayT
MKLSIEGSIAQRCWEEIPKHFSNVQLDEYIIMPNHIHGIIILTESTVGTRHAVSLLEQFSKPVIGSVPTIVRSFKSATTKRIHEIRNTPSLPVWQGRFFEGIIRNDKELNNIRDYIYPVRMIYSIEAIIRPFNRISHGVNNNVLQWVIKSDDPDNIPLW